jgi:GNAT superfamily N-acetyltransferase
MGVKYSGLPFFNEIIQENKLHYTFTEFKPELIPQLGTLIDTYKRVYPKAVVPPAESYLAPWTEGGKNVICALDETGSVSGFAPVSLADVPDKPYTFWTAIRVDPKITFSGELRDALLDRIKQQALEVVQTLPLRKSRIAFQYHFSESDNIDHVISKGGTYTESAFLMKRDLLQEIPAPPLPRGIEIRHSYMTDDVEQNAYLSVRNKAFVEGRPHELTNSAVSINDWLILLHHVYRPNGVFILAYHDRQIIGGITVYRNENRNSESGEKTGITDDVFVVDEWRRKGICSYLIWEGLEYFKAQGLKVAQIEVNSANKRALHLYEQQGYSIMDESPFYVISLE